ncbi:MAG: DNA-methyltransferase [Planctomycetota bacterium]|jgi:DNA modification methylase
MRNEILQGDVIELARKFAAKSVNAIITSPPYFGLRDYDLPPTDWPEVTYAPMAGLPELTIPAMTCCLGLEDSIEAYVGHMVLVFRELRRVLRDDGTAWLNLGDSYMSNGGNRQYGSYDGNTGRADAPAARINANNLKTKNLIGIPWRVAFALQADGWFLRSDIIWAKKNCMPESCQDRPTKAHEYLFLLAKSERYYYDGEAIREPQITTPHAPGWSTKRPTENGPMMRKKGDGTSASQWDEPDRIWGNSTGRNKRTVWHLINEISEHNELFAFTLARLITDHPELLNDILDEYGATTSEKTDIWKLASQPLKDAHFAVMPEALVEPCLLAGCPAQVCVECGEPWVRVVERKKGQPANFNGSTFINGKTGKTQSALSAVGKKERTVSVKTLAFTPTCKCSAPTRPGIVSDPFFGSGTVGVVAKKNKRDWLGIELNPDYVELARKRLDQTQPALFAT